MPFTPLTEPPDGATPDGPALIVAVHEGRSVFVVDDRAPSDGLFLGTLDGRWCFAVDVRDQADVRLASGVPFLSDADLEAALDDAGVGGKVSTTVNERGLAIRLETDGVLFTPGSASLQPAGARIIAHGTDPYGTTDPVHLAYHRRNRERGRLGGQLRLRLRYRMLATDCASTNTCGASRTSAAMRSGQRAAASSAIEPPSLCPTRPSPRARRSLPRTRCHLRRPTRGSSRRGLLRTDRR